MGVKGLVRPADAKRRGLGPLTPTECPSLREWGQGALFPCPPSPRRQEWGFQGGKAHLGEGRRPAASHKKSLPGGQAFSRPKAVLFRGKASPRAEPY